MIPSQNIVAWANAVPWVEPRQVEQDLIISRSLVEMFSDPSLRDALRFRGGTALNKLHLPTPLRYSEDIDLVRTSKGPIGPIISLATLETLDVDRVVEIFGSYMDSSGLTISRAQAQERMFAKLAHPRLWLDIRPLLPADRAAAQTAATQAESFRRVFTDLIDRLPGDPWARTAAMKTRFGIEW